jgi:hypothetical protein
LVEDCHAAVISISTQGTPKQLNNYTAADFRRNNSMLHLFEQFKQKYFSWCKNSEREISKSLENVHKWFKQLPVDDIRLFFEHNLPNNFTIIGTSCKGNVVSLYLYFVSYLFNRITKEIAKKTSAGESPSKDAISSGGFTTDVVESKQKKREMTYYNKVYQVEQLNKGVLACSALGEKQGSPQVEIFLKWEWKSGPLLRREVKWE